MGELNENLSNGKLQLPMVPKLQSVEGDLEDAKKEFEAFIIVFRQSMLLVLEPFGATMVNVWLNVDSTKDARCQCKALFENAKVLSVWMKNCQKDLNFLNIEGCCDEFEDTIRGVRDSVESVIVSFSFFYTSLNIVLDFFQDVPYESDELPQSVRGTLEALKELLMYLGKG